MTLVSSGQISMGDINVELGRSRTTEISINLAENGTLVTLRVGASPQPSPTDPAAVSEWYGYRHLASYPHTFRASVSGTGAAGNSGGSCGFYANTPITLYTTVPTIVVGTLIYTSSELTSLSDGGGTEYYNNETNKGITWTSVGSVTALYSCATYGTWQFNSTGQANNTNACGTSGTGLTLYSATAVLAVGTILYTNPELTLVFNGGSLFRRCSTGASNFISYRINSSGSITEEYSCI